MESIVDKLNRENAELGAHNRTREEQEVEQRNAEQRRKAMLTYKAAMAGADVEHAKIVAAEHHAVEGDESISSTHAAELQSDLDAATARREALLAAKAQHAKEVGEGHRS